MSGGSWNYAYRHLEELAESLRESRQPERRALGKRMSLMAQAAHDIEWVDSGDLSPGDDLPAINTALGKHAPAEAANAAIEGARETLRVLSDAIARLERTVGGKK